MSPINQNELIGIVAKYTIQIWLKKIKSRSISVDKVSYVYVYVYVQYINETMMADCTI